ncbi:MAG TPA: HAD family hydrolase [Actinomycetales bacterium]|nr:HAD family hydrolase [Actinomycetales bacterium]
MDLVLFDLDGTLVDHDSAAGAAVETWLLGTGWVDAVDVAALVVDWDRIAERHFAAYRAGQINVKDQRRARLRDFLPRIAIDASDWPDERLDSVFRGYLAAYEAAWRAFPDASPSLEAVRRLTQVGVLSNGDLDQQVAKVARNRSRPAPRRRADLGRAGRRQTRPEHLHRGLLSAECAAQGNHVRR